MHPAVWKPLHARKVPFFIPGGICSCVPGDSSLPVMKLFIDDERNPPEGWTHVLRPKNAIDILKTGSVDEISLDHDLVDDVRDTGYDVILWIEETEATWGFVPPKIVAHIRPILLHARRWKRESEASIAHIRKTRPDNLLHACTVMSLH